MNRWSKRKHNLAMRDAIVLRALHEDTDPVFRLAWLWLPSSKGHIRNMVRRAIRSLKSQGRIKYVDGGKIRVVL